MRYAHCQLVGCEPLFFGPVPEPADPPKPGFPCWQPPHPCPPPRRPKCCLGRRHPQWLKPPDHGRAQPLSGPRPQFQPPIRTRRAKGTDPGPCRRPHRSQQPSLDDGFGPAPSAVWCFHARKCRPPEGVGVNASPHPRCSPRWFRWNQRRQCAGDRFGQAEARELRPGWMRWNPLLDETPPGKRSRAVPSAAGRSAPDLSPGGTGPASWKEGRVMTVTPAKTGSCLRLGLWHTEGESNRAAIPADSTLAGNL